MALQSASASRDSKVPAANMSALAEPQRTPAQIEGNVLSLQARKVRKASPQNASAKMDMVAAHASSLVQSLVRGKKLKHAMARETVCQRKGR